MQNTQLHTHSPLNQVFQYKVMYNSNQIIFVLVNIIGMISQQVTQCSKNRINTVTIYQSCQFVFLVYWHIILNQGNFTCQCLHYLDSYLYCSYCFYLSIRFNSYLSLGYEDYQRYKSDQELNHQYKSLIFQDDAFVKKQWADIQVGNIVKVLQNQFFPADMILIASSQPTGNAFIETSSLDGQKSLKVRKAYNQTKKYNCEQFLINFQGKWIGAVPDKDMHRFSSKLQTQHSIIQYEGDKQLLYRGAKLKNTKWIYGLVIYTGKNSKIMMNLNESSNKMSQIQTKVNYLLIYIFGMQVIFCLTSAIFYSNFRRWHQHTYFYIDWPVQSILQDSILSFFSHFILLSTFIPISLIISIEVVKIFQSFFINKDKLMFSYQRKKGVIAKSFGLNQELGQVGYVLTDKTGTLTKNVMLFKIAIFGDSHTFGDQHIVKRCNINFKNLQQLIQYYQLVKNNQMIYSLVIPYINYKEFKV